MSAKTYYCERYQSLMIAGVCQFVNGRFTTSSPGIQSKIELSQSFISNTVKLEEVDDEVPLEEERLTFTELSKMRKAQLAELAEQMGLSPEPDAIRADLLAMISAEMRRDEG
jgi:hypothetical protein